MESPEMLKRSWVSLAMCLTFGSYGQTSAPLPNGTIWVPTLVESKSGKIAYGLSVDDFSIKDNGVEQQIILQSDMGAQPISLLLVIQTGRSSAAELAKISRLPDLLDSILTSPQDQIAIVTFDSSPHPLQALTRNSDAISSSFASISPGNSASALFDAMQMAISSLRKAAPGNQKVIILISGEHDHGSIGSDAASLVREISSSNTSVYSMSFRPGKTEVFGKLRSLNPLAMTGSAMQRNASEALAQLTGGDFFRFNNERDFEERIGDIGNHIHNRYNLAIQPSDPRPGFHSLQVEVRQPKVNIVSVREGYWASDGSMEAGKAPFQPMATFYRESGVKAARCR
jgi:VWFA-related protein